MQQEKKMLAHISEDGTRVQTVAEHLMLRSREPGLDCCMISENTAQNFKSACRAARK